MYPIEQAMKVFKGYVRNRSRPKTSMEKGYILDETIGFVTNIYKIFTMFNANFVMQMKRMGFVVKLWKRYQKVDFGPCRTKCGTSICYHKCGMFSTMGPVHNL
jgi:hypothetical protein